MLKLLPYISTYSGLLPLLAGVLFARRKPFIMFTIFIALGFLVDVIVAHSPSDKFEHFCMFSYSIIDILFLGYFVLNVLYPQMYGPIKLVAGLSILTFWFFTYKMWSPAFDSFPEYSFVFDASLEIMLALLAAYALIKITEGLDDTQTQDYLFFLTGIFFYNFCTFFIHSFVGDDFVEHIWFLGGIINIITMIIYTYAFYRQGVLSKHKIMLDKKWSADQLNIRYRN